MLVRMRNRTAVVVSFVSAFVSIFCDRAAAYNVLMATMGGTKSHTIPFVALGISLKTRGHNVTLLSAFPGPAASNGLQEFVPPIFQVIRKSISFLHPLFLIRTLFEILIYSFGRGGQGVPGKLCVFDQDRSQVFCSWRRRDVEKGLVRV